MALGSVAHRPGKEALALMQAGGTLLLAYRGLPGHSLCPRALIPNPECADASPEVLLELTLGRSGWAKSRTSSPSPGVAAAPLATWSSKPGRAALRLHAGWVGNAWGLPETARRRVPFSRAGWAAPLLTHTQGG